MNLPEDWQIALEHRRHLLADQMCLRLLHIEGGDFRCDRFGQICWGYWYSDEDPPASMYTRLDELCTVVGARCWHLHGMSDRGSDPQRRRHWSSQQAPICWQATEGDLQFTLRSDRGQSPGLFLDQRENRCWVRRNSTDRRVANLFSYTGAFGLAAAAGGAAHVEQIDVSKPYLQWSAQNAELNDLGRMMTHTSVDAQLFLSGCQKRGRQFDAIICDPPSFARGRRGQQPWRVIDHLPALAEIALRQLAPDGWLLITSNHEGWSPQKMRESLQKLDATRIEPAASAGEDFTLDGAESLLKGFVLWR